MNRAFGEIREYLKGVRDRIFFKKRFNPDYSPRNFVVPKANLKMCMKRTWVH